jgi:hypothetical protein
VNGANAGLPSREQGVDERFGAPTVAWRAATAARRSGTACETSAFARSSAV